MKKIGIVLITTLVVFILGGVYAQDTWSLERCINHALENNLDIRNQHLQLEGAGHDVMQSYMYMLPSINTGSRLSVSYGRSTDDVTNEIFTERIMSQRLSANASLVLFSGFRTINNIRYQLARQTAFRYDTEKHQNDLILTIANAYLQIMYFEDMLEIRAEQLELSRQKVSHTRVLLNGGTVSQRDMLEMEAIAAEYEVAYTSVENQLNLSYLELIHLLELDPEDDFRIERPELQLSEVQFFYDAAVIYENASHIEPGLGAARERILMAENGLAMVKGERMPTLSLGAELGSAYSDVFERLVEPNNHSRTLNSHTAYNLPVRKNDEPLPVWETIPYRDQLSENYSRNAHITINIPIFNHFQTRTRVQQARIQVDQARNNYERTKNQLSRVIHQAHADAKAAYTEYLSNAKALEASEASFAFAEEGFNLGRVSTYEFSEAQARLNRAQVNMLQSMYEFVFKVKILEFYQGEGFVL